MKTTSVDKDSIKAKKWMRKTGIALVCQTETREELTNVWNKWQSLSNEDREKSNKKSIELFGMDNKSHYEILQLLFV